VDDGSTDGTAERAAALAHEDPRVSVHRNPRRLGMLLNTNRAWELARALHPEAEFRALASDHDLWEPTWLEALLAALAAHPAAVLAYPLARRVDDEGREVPGYGGWRCDTTGVADPRTRLRAAYVCMVAGDMVYGFARAGALDAVGTYRPVLVPDRLLLAQLALRGEFAQVDAFLWTRRYAGLADLERQRQAFWPAGAPAYTRVPWWLTHAALVAWEQGVGGAPGTRVAGARLALELLGAGARLRTRRRVQRARLRAGEALEGPTRALLRRSPRARALVAGHRLPVPEDTQAVLARLLEESRRPLL